MSITCSRSSFALLKMGLLCSPWHWWCPPNTGSNSHLLDHHCLHAKELAWDSGKPCFQSPSQDLLSLPHPHPTGSPTKCKPLAAWEILPGQAGGKVASAAHDGNRREGCLAPSAVAFMAGACRARPSAPPPTWGELLNLRLLWVTAPSCGQPALSAGAFPAFVFLLYCCCFFHHLPHLKRQSLESRQGHVWSPGSMSFGRLPEVARRSVPRGVHRRPCQSATLHQPSASGGCFTQPHQGTSFGHLHRHRNESCSLVIAAAWKTIVERGCFMQIPSVPNMSVTIGENTSNNPSVRREAGRHWKTFLCTNTVRAKTDVALGVSVMRVLSSSFSPFLQSSCGNLVLDCDCDKQEEG